MRIKFDEARRILDENPDAVILDVREEAEYVTGHARDAQLLPLDEIDEDSAAEWIPSFESPVLVYCKSGSRSLAAAKRLENLGYTKVYDIGSLVNWPYGMSID